MKKKLLIAASVIVCNVVAAQQRPQYTQYILNNYIINPALSGIENYTDVKFSARDQWVGLSGAPRTMYFTIQGPIGKKDYKTTATSFNIPGENPRGNAYWENYTASEPHHGVGLTILNDKTGNFNRFTTYATYAYHLGLSPRTNLAAGFSAGITMVGLNADGKIDFGGNNPSDPAVASAVGELNKVKPDLGVGLWLYSADYFVGVSAQQVIPQKLAFVDDATFQAKGRLIPHLFATAGYRFLINDDLNALPSVMVKYISGAFKNSYQGELNLKLQYRDLFWIGGSYRQFDGYAAMLGFNVGNTFNVGYAYDVTTTDLRTYSRGTHELMIGFLIGNRYGDTCPRNVW
ncbi:MAG: type IX secretion system membrane protein PorP/SprF [Bacteroidota bacterium]|nr:type IX secretion system membrane protein PorP/SprF [Bacteroidota bacterium]